MTTLREAAQLALTAMEESEEYGQYLPAGAIDTLREALAHPEPEPVAWIFTWYEIAKDRHVRRIIDCEERPNIPGYDLIPLFTHPIQRKPLTDKQIKPIFEQWKILYGDYTIDLIRAIERAHGIGSEK